MIAVFRISRAYRKLTVWRGDSMTGRLSCTATYTPNLIRSTRRSRYDDLALCVKESGFVMPVYKEKGPV